MPIPLLQVMIPFSVLKPENFCTIASSVSSLNDKILSEYKTDSFYSEICNYLSDNTRPIPHPQIKDFSLSNSFLLFNYKIYVPTNCRLSVLKLCHGSPTAGHFGFKKTCNLVLRDFWWPSIHKDVKKYISSCQGGGSNDRSVLTREKDKICFIKNKFY